METISLRRVFIITLSQYLLSAVYAELAKTPHQTGLPVQTPAKEVEWPCNELSI